GVVTRVAFREGDERRKGQVLFQLDPRPFQTALSQAQATRARDRAQAEKARLDAERAHALFQQNVISQADWDQARTQADAWKGTLEADEAAVRHARLNLEHDSFHAS